MKVVRTRSRIAWMGRYSGYDRVCDFLGHTATGFRFTDVHRGLDPIGGFHRRLIDFRRQGCSRSPLYDVQSYLLERRVSRVAWRERPDLVHLMYLETDLGMLEDPGRRGGAALMATAHQPPSWWKVAHGVPEVVQALDGLVVLTARDAAFWEQWIPGRVFLLPHGVDVDFFSPEAPDRLPSGEPSCLVVGHWLRDLETLAVVIDRLLQTRPRLRVDYVLPLEARASKALLRLARHGQVVFHAGLADEELRELYRRASVLLLPLLDATANNAILEAQACGTPIVSTEIPSVASYVDRSFAELLQVGDVEGMAAAVLRILDDDGERRRRGVAAREHAVKELAWQGLGPQMLEVYASVVSRRS